MFYVLSIGLYHDLLIYQYYYLLSRVRYIVLTIIIIHLYNIP